MEINQAIVFAILMQNGEGIKSKAPEYIKEKLEVCEHDPQPSRMLDAANKQIFDEWVAFWSSHMERSK